MLLLTRPFDSWYSSVLRVLDAYIMRRYPLKMLLPGLDRASSNFWKRFTRDPADCAYGVSCVPGSPEHRELVFRAYERLHKHVREVVPPEQLLVMDVTKGEGFPELCRFLGLSSTCPNEPFPRVNSSGEIDAIRKALLVLEALCYVLPVGILALVWWCCRRRSSKSKPKGE